MHNTASRKALRKCLEKAGIERRFTVHGSWHTFNNLLRRNINDGVLVRRPMTGHASEEMTGHYSDVELDEKRQAVVGLTLIVGGQSAASLSGNQMGTTAKGSSRSKTKS